MFCESIGNNVVSALMLWEDLFRLMGPPNVVVFKVYVLRQRGDEWCFAEFDRRHAVGEHDRGFIMRVSEDSSELTIMEQILCSSRETDVLPFRGALLRYTLLRIGYSGPIGILRTTSPLARGHCVWSVQGWSPILTPSSVIGMRLKVVPAERGIAARLSSGWGTIALRPNWMGACFGSA